MLRAQCDIVIYLRHDTMSAPRLTRHASWPKLNEAADGDKVIDTTDLKLDHDVIVAKALARTLPPCVPPPRRRTSEVATSRLPPLVASVAKRRRKLMSAPQPVANPITQSAAPATTTLAKSIQPDSSDKNNNSSKEDEQPGPSTGSESLAAIEVAFADESAMLLKELSEMRLLLERLLTMDPNRDLSAGRILTTTTREELFDLLGLRLGE